MLRIGKRHGLSRHSLRMWWCCSAEAAACRCVGSPEAGALTPEHAKLITNFAKAVVRRLQALKFVQLDAVSHYPAPAPTLLPYGHL